MRVRVRQNRGFTLIELLVVVAVIGIIAAIATHQLLRARAAANEASAIGTLRAIASGQIGFAATCGNGYFTDSLTTLADSKYVSPDASMTPKSGFSFAMEAGAPSGYLECLGNASVVSYYVKAERLTPTTGNRGFAVNQVGTIWQNIGSTAPAEPFLVTASITPIQ
jgi:type IV pilus assembly protein PilA